MNYVVHYCKNKQCNNAWIDKDLTNTKSRPPQWKYCKECCKKMKIDFDKQQRILSEKQKEKLMLMEQAKKLKHCS